MDASWERLIPFWEFLISDAVDIIVVTAFLYTGIVLIRRTRAAFVAVGMVILSAVYIAARFFNLQLTVWMLQGFFAVFVFSLVVIFQEELRQWFERLAVWSLRRRPGRDRGGSASTSDALVQCLADFARDRIGALVVLPGRQPIYRHIHGGIELDGHLSFPLLKSIFDPHSPGHDGAVIIEDGRVRRFAVHLPLSTDFQQLRGVGTRHSAALGLAELTDALCLVVSEERGRISAARDGRLVALEGAAELTSILRQFRDAQQPQGVGARSGFDLLRRNWLEKVASLLLVIGLWYLYVPGSRPAQMTYAVPIEVIDLPEEYVLAGVEPQTVEVTLRGPTRHFYFLDSRRLSVRIDVGLARLGRRTFQIGEQDVRRPSDLEIANIEPSVVRLTVSPAPKQAKGNKEG
jgi:uncharacterized protein (TIGR00159 family)